MTFLVTIDGAGGGVKDLEYLIGSPHWQPPVILVEICIPMMPPGAYITDRRCISPVLPSASASVREVAFFSGIGKWRRSRSRFLRGELSSYAQRRGSADVSAHGPFNICSVWHHLCAEASVRQRLCALASYQRMLFRTAFGTDLLGEETPCQSFIQFLCFHRLFFM